MTPIPDPFGIPILRLALAAVGLACLSMAIWTGAFADAPAGRCLSAAAQPHCAWCWAAVAALLAAACPRPRLPAMRRAAQSGM